MRFSGSDLLQPLPHIHLWGAVGERLRGTEGELPRRRTGELLSMQIVARLSSPKAYDALIDAFRARMAALETTGEAVDHVAGVPLGYTTKIMAQVRNLGRHSLPAILCTLGLQIVLVEDPAFATIRARLAKSSHPRWTTRPAPSCRPSPRRSRFSIRTRWARLQGQHGMAFSTAALLGPDA